MVIRCPDHVTPLYPQKLALTSPTGGGRSVGIVRSRTKATEFRSFIRPRLNEVGHLKSLKRKFALERQDPADSLMECQVPEKRILTYIL